jgi:hypothetical protein
MLVKRFMVKSNLACPLGYSVVVKGLGNYSTNVQADKNVVK